jgi:alpha-N-acetylglucosaminidase
MGGSFGAVNDALIRQGAFLLVGAVVAYGAIKIARAKIYDTLIVSLTTEWYERVLLRLAPKSVMLDVGIGTGLALVNNKTLLEAKGIKVEGVDYDLDYVKHCKEVVAERGLSHAIKVQHTSIYDFKGGPYDAVYFSASLMIMPDPVIALKHGISMLKPKVGRIYITLTIQTQKSIIAEYGKPLLKFLTTIDFGNVTYEEDLMVTLKKAGLTVLENVSISQSSMEDTRSFRLFVCQP